ncbi:MAG: T9SS type A sorting domain-containing protein [Dysgonamonadaceae bacterium]|nr:T9SS type A sorting domain-containing protein [Dysgonamonadaceae bacterium]
MKVRSAKNTSIQLYNVTGRLIHSVNASGTVTLPVEKGIYIVKVIALNGEQQLTKLRY